MPAKMIKTAQQHTADIVKLHAKLSKEEREFKRKQAELEAYEDLRDDIITLVDRSGLTDEDINARCGPVPQTLNDWRNKRVRKPTLAKMQSVARILGKDIGLIDHRRKEKK